jgi:hypothetical protein
LTSSNSVFWDFPLVPSWGPFSSHLCSHVCTPPQIESLLPNYMCFIRLLPCRVIYLVRGKALIQGTFSSSKYGWGIIHLQEKLDPGDTHPAKRFICRIPPGTSGMHTLEVENHVKGTIIELLLPPLHRNKAP